MIRTFLKSSFFKHSAWVTFAAFAGGGAMALVQIVAYRMAKTSEGEYLLFIAMLDIIGQLAIPTLGIQATLAHQTAAAADPASRQKLAANARAVFGCVILLWLVAGVLAGVFHQRLMVVFSIPNWVVLPVTLFAALVGMATPIAAGMLQGKQDFVWYGWATLLNGAVRLAAVSMTVLVLGGKAAGAITAVLIGSTFTLALMAIKTRGIWTVRGGKADVRALIRRILPVSVIIGVPTFIFMFDSMVVKSAFTGADEYGAARQVGRTLVFLTAPMVYVMFPKIVQSAARSEKSNVLMLTLGVTALVGGISAAFLTFVPTLPLKVLFGSASEAATKLVPWFAWCMLPLALSNVLINNLLARERFGALPWLVLVAIAYGVTLHFYHPSLLTVVKTIGVFGLALLAVCIAFSVTPPKPAVKAAGQG